MSAWMCGAAHWSVLAERIARNDERTPEEIFTILAQTNKDSIDCRYAEGIAGDPDYMYDHTDPFDGGYKAHQDTDWSPEEIAVMMSCYDYQSCEHEGWETSEAYRLIMAQFAAELGEWDSPEELSEKIEAAHAKSDAARSAVFLGYTGRSLWGISWDTRSVASTVAK